MVPQKFLIWFSPPPSYFHPKFTLYLGKKGPKTFIFGKTTPLPQPVYSPKIPNLMKHKKCIKTYGFLLEETKI